VTLCDTGPMVALVDEGDQNHRRCVETLSLLPPRPLLTTWPCLTEAMHLLHRAAGIRAQNELWGFLADGVLQLHLPLENEWQRMRALMNQYADMPLDLADASLISIAETSGNRRLFSLDQRLRAAKIKNQHVFEVVP
jgi:uncharacterized protein